MKVDLFRKNISSDFYLPGFNQYEIEINNFKSGLYKFKPDIVFIILDLPSDYPKFIWNNIEKDNEKIVETYLQKLNNLVSKIQSKINCI